MSWPATSGNRPAAAADEARPRPLLEVSNLGCEFSTGDGLVRAVDDITFSLTSGKTLAIVGESGSGKSATAISIMGLHDRRNTKLYGRATFDGMELLSAPHEQVRLLRGRRMAMIFQDPLSSLHPHYTIGYQISEAIRVHEAIDGKGAMERVVDLLARVGVASPRDRLKSYPHEFSGGMRQRVMIAMALSCGPDLILADEPTTALDVTVQAQILELLADLQREFGTAIILITHDLGLVASVADDVLVMYAGQAVEQAPVYDLFARPSHPYTRGLLASAARLDGQAGSQLPAIAGVPPSPIALPAGCPFQPRCPDHHLVGDRCTSIRPRLEPATSRHVTACHLAQDVAAGLSPAQRSKFYEETQ